MCSYLVSVAMERVGSKCTAFSTNGALLNTHASGIGCCGLQGMWGGVCEYVMPVFLSICCEEFPTLGSPMQLVAQGSIQG